MYRPTTLNYYLFLVVVGGKIEDTLCDQYECREALALELSV